MDNDEINPFEMDFNKLFQCNNEDDIYFEMRKLNSFKIAERIAKQIEWSFFCDEFNYCAN